jgi:hypothetical protein
VPGAVLIFSAMDNMTPQQNQQQGSQFSPVQPVALPAGFGGKQASPTSTIGILTNQVNEIINTGNALGYDTSNLASAFGVAVNQYSRTKDTKYIGQFQSQLNSTAKSVNELVINRKKEQDKLAIAEQKQIADAVVDLSADLNTLSNRGVQLPSGFVAEVERLNSGEMSSTQARVLSKTAATLVQETSPQGLAAKADLEKKERERMAEISNKQEQFSKSQSMLEQIKEIYNPDTGKTIPGFEGAVGGSFEKLGILKDEPFKASKAFGVFERIKQLQGGTFLEAYKSLKGGGSITEVEGKKAESAIARLNPGQSEEDFKQSLTDLYDTISSANARLSASVQATYGGGETQAPAQTQPQTEAAPPASSESQPSPLQRQFETDEQRKKREQMNRANTLFFGR